MKKVAWTDETSWDEVLRQSEREDVVVMRGGHAVALLTPFDDDDMRWYKRECDPAFLETIAVARRQVRRGMTIGNEDLKKTLGIHIEDDPMTLDQVLDLLESFQQRATYTAVAGVVKANPRTVMKDRPQDSRHSWVVAKKTGQPTGYPQTLRHDGARVRTHVIAEPEELRRWLRSPGEPSESGLSSGGRG